MSALVLNSASCATWKMKIQCLNSFTSSSKKLCRSNTLRLGNNRRNNVRAFLFNPVDPDRPIIKEALKEPIAFMGGVFAGLLRLDLNDDPLREWVTRTLESAGITEEEIVTEGSKPEDFPQQIEIE